MKKLILFCFFIAITNVVHAQKVTIQVSDNETKENIEYASILFPDHKKSFVANEKGIFIVDVNKYKLPLKVIIEQFGFEKKEITLQNNTNVYNIFLESTSELLQEIIIPPANAKIKERIYGRTNEGSGKIVGSSRNYDENNRFSGLEFGLVLNTNNKLKKVKKIHWHINDADFKKAVFGLQFYEVENGKPTKKIPHTEINFTIKGKKNGWNIVNVEDLDIYIDGHKKIAAVLKTQQLEFYPNKKEASLSLNIGVAVGNVLVGRDSQYEEWEKIPMNYPFYITVDSYE